MRVLIVGAVFGLLQISATGAQPAVDTSDWNCEYCPETSGWQGWITAGAGSVSDDSFKFGDYTGLHEEGGFLILDGRLLYRSEDGYYTDLYVEDLGLESRSLSLSGGRQGRYDYHFTYDNIPHYIDGTTRSPFIGSDNLQLPGSWVPAGNTAGMTALSDTLREVDLLREREILSAGFGFIQSDHWEYTLDFQRQTRSGIDTIGGSFLNSGALLPMPIDSVTDQIDLGVAFNTRTLQVHAAYYGSFFSNNHSTLTWDNPFTPLVAGADAGQLALPPDNDFHQFSLSATWQIGKSTRANAAVAVGEMTQNDPFPASTVNPNLSPAALPRSSLNGEVGTLNYHIRLITSPIDKLDLRFKHRFSERDNQTPRENYQQVDSDIFLSTLRANIPYSFERSTTEISADYRLPADIELTAGVERDTRERTFQDVSETEENSGWIEASTYLWSMLDVRLKVAQETRDASVHDPFDEIIPGQNPALRKFYMADRERDSGRLYVAVSPLDWLSIGLTADATEDQYSESQIGLTAAEQSSYAADVSIGAFENINIYLFAAYDEIDSDMAGSRNFSSADWFALQRDTVHTAGAGIEMNELLENMDIGIDYTHSRSRGEIELLPTPAVPFPDLKTTLDNVKLYVKYRLKDHLVLRFDYYKERYRTQDWALDGVGVDTIPTLLTVGQTSPDYSVDVVATVLEYNF